MNYKEELYKYQPYLDYIDEYAKSKNAATGSKVDSNANVEHKNVTTLTGELYKKDGIGINRLRMYKKLTEMYGEDYAQKYIDQLESHVIYKHDETNPLLPYCVSITMYPFLFDGLHGIGGGSGAPHNLDSFAGSFINLCFAIASQFAGAVSTPEFLAYMDFFIRKEYGDDYYINSDKVVDMSSRGRTIDKVICDKFEQIVYSLNQPAAARNFQCVRGDTTQLWTPDGFKYLHELKEGDKCYVWKDGKFGIDTIDHLNVYDYNGELMQFSGSGYQQTVTPNHRVVYKNTDGTGTYLIKEAKDVFGHSKLSMPICGDNSFDDYPISDELLMACTYALTDGSLTRANDNAHKYASYQLRYYMSPNRKGFKKLTDALTKLGITFDVKDGTANQFGEVKIVSVSNIEASAICNALENTKKKLPDLYKRLSKRQAQLVLDCWSETDGQQLRQLNSNQENQKRLLLQCDNYDIADSVQIVCLLAGYGSKIITRSNLSIDGSKERKTIYVQTFSRDCKRIKEYKKVQYSGKVWCPSTKTGVVVFREENGMPYISGNSIFWNIAYFDKPYFEGLFENFVFPDGSSMKWESVSWLQKRFMKWFNKERTKQILTFPVETLNLLDDGENYVDQEWADFAAEMLAEGHSFFNYRSNSVDSLASCCRLRNELQDNTFSFTLGAGGVSTGSKSVITINMNRLIQNAVRENLSIEDVVKEQVQDIHKYLLAYNELLKDMFNAKLLPVYDAGFISLEKQFLTIGINGLVEGAEYLGYSISPDDKEYCDFINSILSVIYQENKKAKTSEVMFNTEYVPAENLGVKNAKWDKEDGYFSPRDCYNSYFYLVEDMGTTPIDKFLLHGKTMTGNLDGGAALHLNLDEHLSKEQYKQLMKIAIKTGCSYWTVNVPNTICNECGYISKHHLDHCEKCGGTNLDYATRVIGYLKRVSNFSEARQKEAQKRYYAKS